MAVAPAGVGLPELDEHVGHWLCVLVDDPAMHHDALADGFLAGLGKVDDEIVIVFTQHVVAECGAGFLAQRAGKADERLFRGP